MSRNCRSARRMARIPHIARLLSSILRPPIAHLRVARMHTTHMCSRRVWRTAESGVRWVHRTRTFILTTSADGGVPVQFRCANGNTNAFTYGRYGSRNGRGTYDC
jgi:hypothetical protein